MRTTRGSHVRARPCLLYYLVLIAARQTHQALWASEGCCSAAAANSWRQAIKRIRAANLYCFYEYLNRPRPRLYVSRESGLLNPGARGRDRWLRLLYRGRRGAGGDNQALNAGGGIGHGRVHRRASGLMDVYFVLGNGVKSLSDEVAGLWLMGNFWGRERKKWRKIFAPQTVTQSFESLTEV